MGSDPPPGHYVITRLSHTGMDTQCANWCQYIDTGSTCFSDPVGRGCRCAAVFDKLPVSVFSAVTALMWRPSKGQRPVNEPTVDLKWCPVNQLLYIPRSISDNKNSTTQFFLAFTSNIQMKKYGLLNYLLLFQSYKLSTTKSNNYSPFY